MSYQVQINDGQTNVSLPGQPHLYNAGDVVTLTDDQYNSLTPHAQQVLITVLSHVADGGGGTGGGGITSEADPIAGPRITSETTARTAADTAETNRAQAAEAAKADASALTTETTRATAAEGAEATRATAAEQAASTAASNEATRAQAAEGAIGPLTATAKVLVACQSFNTNDVVWIDPATNTQVYDLAFADPGLDVTPTGLAVSSDGRIAYTTLKSTQGQAVAVFDTVTGKHIGGWITTDLQPLSCKLSLDDRTLYVLCKQSKTMIAFDTTSWARRWTANLSPAGPQSMEMTPDGSLMLVTDFTNGKVYPVTLATGAVGTAITVGASPYGITMTADGKTAYVANNGQTAQSVSVINVATLTVTATITGIGTPTFSQPLGIRVSPDQSTVWVTCKHDSTIVPISIPANTVGTPIPVASTPYLFAISDDGRYAYVSCYGLTDNVVGGFVSVVDLVNKVKVTDVATTGGNPCQVAYVRDRSALTAHKASTTAHSADRITFNDTGLIVVKGANLEAALTAADAWMNARPTNESGLLAALPANGARPDNSTYFATDQYGGTTYRMVAGAWAQQSAGVTQASGQIVAGPVSMNGAANFDLKAIGTVVTDVPGMSVAVPAYARGVLLRAKFEVQANSGTAAVGTYVRVLLLLTDAANAIIGAGQVTFVQVIAAAQVFGGQVAVEKYLPAPVAGGTYKLRAQLAAAAPANWTSALLFPGNGSGGASSEDYFYAQAV